MSAVFSLICLVMALVCYAISQLQQHGQLRWQDNNDMGFWGTKGYKRKYLEGNSTDLFVFLTDGYHFMQFMFFNFLALGFTLALGWSWWLLGALLVGIRLIHWALRETFKKSSI